ncbi:hypothetical protein OG496_06655 [Streptomyces sp. NBC_00988]|uniref:hypothetical protein n=1 Tax=Streptomyces sp. NBC_00988 TaxID=2903704 RepID=UPI003865C048|nr:hypothetical protein OG496_06655 [Streptomyces sp. NBC_00988]
MGEEAAAGWSAGSRTQRRSVSRRRGPDFFRLRYRVDEDRVVIASSGIPQPDDRWTVLPYREVLEIRRAGLRVMTTRAVPHSDSAPSTTLAHVNRR